VKGSYLESYVINYMLDLLERTGLIEKTFIGDHFGKASTDSAKDLYFLME